LLGVNNRCPKSNGSITTTILMLNFVVKGTSLHRTSSTNAPRDCHGNDDGDQKHQSEVSAVESESLASRFFCLLITESRSGVNDDDVDDVHESEEDDDGEDTNEVLFGVSRAFMVGGVESTGTGDDVRLVVAKEETTQKEHFLQSQK